MARYISPGKRVMDVAYLRDNSDNEYTGEALLLALLLHTKGKSRRTDSEQVAKMLDDPNQKKARRV